MDDREVGSTACSLERRANYEERALAPQVPDVLENAEGDVKRLRSAERLPRVVRNRRA
jgi:hypothetical protein